MLPAAAPPHPSPWRDRLVGVWGRGVLVAIVFALGLLQGSRAALGDIPLDELADVAAPPTADAAVVESDALRGHFFRPPGSNAVRPELRTRPSAWSPAPPAAP
jgi:hypothetical protein